MIEKLDINRFSSQIELKINELVDAVNELHEEAESNAHTRAYHEKLIDTLVAENNIHEKQIDELQMKVNKLASNINFAQLEVKENVQADPYAERRKWIGTLCKFWDYDGEEKWFSILEHIDKNSPYSYCASGDWWYKHCEPIKPEDIIIYKGE